jgi:hypothetical protein
MTIRARTCPTWRHNGDAVSILKSSWGTAALCQLERALRRGGCEGEAKSDVAKKAAAKAAAKAELTKKREFVA